MLNFLQKLLLIVLLHIPYLCLCQHAPNELRQGFALADIPAYKILQVDPSEIFRPSVAPEIVSLIASGIPGKFDFGGEITPLRSRIHSQNAAIRTYRLSLAYTNTNNTPSLGVGLRSTLYSKGLKNLGYQQQNLQFEMDRQVFVDSLQLYYARRRNVSIYQLLEDPELKKEMDDFVSLKLEEIKKVNGPETIRGTTWNMFVLSVGYGLLLKKKDTLSDHISTGRLGYWVSCGIPLGRRGQFVGSYYGCSNYLPSKFYQSITLSTRLYMGSNRLKAFVEAQMKFNDLGIRNSFLYDAGGEVNLYSGLWLDFYAGIMNYFSQRQVENSSAIVSRLSIRLTIPNDFTLN